MPGRVSLPFCLFVAAGAIVASTVVAEPPTYTSFELSGISPGNNFVYAISDPVSNGGSVVGPVVIGDSFNQFTTPSLSWRPVVWRPAIGPSPTDIMPVAIAGNSSVNRASDVSPDGTKICGMSNGFGGDGLQRGRRWIFDPATGVASAPESLHSGGNATEAAGINSAGRCVGWRYNANQTFTPMTWAPDMTTGATLGLPAGSDQYQIPREISEAPSEYIVGRSDRTSPVATRGIIWKHMSPTNYGVGELLPLLGGATSDAFGICPNGALAGGTTSDGTPFSHGARWAAPNVPPTVSSFGQYNGLPSFVMDVNNAGVGVGFYLIDFQTSRAALFFEGQGYDLGSLSPDIPGINSTVFLRIAYGINSAGQIAGTYGPSGLFDSPGRAFVLTPIPDPTECVLLGDINQDSVIDGLDIAGYMRAKLSETPMPGESQACADFGNNDVSLDTLEFLDALLP